MIDLHKLDEDLRKLDQGRAREPILIWVKNVTPQDEEDLVGIIECNRSWTVDSDVEVVHWVCVPPRIADLFGIVESDNLSPARVKQLSALDEWRQP